MRYAYYDRLNRRQQAVYRRSDEVTRIRLTDPRPLRPLVEDLREALTGEERARAEAVASRLIAGIVSDLDVPPVRVRVLAARPSRGWGELHGLYEPEEEGRRARISVWMRTARHKRVVAFKTFLRTLLHEMCHHLDYEMLALEESFHTEGFFKRESSLYYQLVGD